MNVNGKYLKDENGNTISPITSMETVFDSNGNYLTDATTITHGLMSASDKNYLNNLTQHYSMEQEIGYIYTGSSYTPLGPIYRKTIVFSNVTVSNDYSYPHRISNLNRVLNVQASFYDGTTSDGIPRRHTFPMFLYGYENPEYLVTFWIGNSDINFRIHSNQFSISASSKRVYTFIIDYTKSA